MGDFYEDNYKWCMKNDKLFKEAWEEYEDALLVKNMKAIDQDIPDVLYLQENFIRYY